jgi:hypothetical protein
VANRMTSSRSLPPEEPVDGAPSTSAHGGNFPHEPNRFLRQNVWNYVSRSPLRSLWNLEGMPWRESRIVDQRLQFLWSCQTQEMSVADLCPAVLFKCRTKWAIS